jgi:NDP-sugar pyrophosphorylase family protein
MIELEHSANLIGDNKINIHAFADVSPKAELGKGVHVGSGSVIGPDVIIGPNTWIGPNVIIDGKVKIGSNNKIFPGACIGLEPQDLKYKGDFTDVLIGDNNIFREYDIRGIADVDLDNDTVYLIGKAFGKYLIVNKHNTLSISGDVRKTTDRIKKSFIKGALSQGIDVTDLGTLPTPTNYFSLYNTKIINSVQVTGSHNPSE